MLKVIGGNNIELGTVPPQTLRLACRCATCVDETSGKKLIRVKDVERNVRPVTQEVYGNYALSVNWSDGHSSLYPYKQLKALLKELKESKEVEEGGVGVRADNVMLEGPPR